MMITLTNDNTIETHLKMEFSDISDFSWYGVVIFIAYLTYHSFKVSLQIRIARIIREDINKIYTQKSQLPSLLSSTIYQDMDMTNSN